MTSSHIPTNSRLKRASKIPSEATERAMYLPGSALASGLYKWIKAYAIRTRTTDADAPDPGSLPAEG
jgi:hypothetical protein